MKIIKSKFTDELWGRVVISVDNDVFIIGAKEIYDPLCRFHTGIHRHLMKPSRLFLTSDQWDVNLKI